MPRIGIVAGEPSGDRLGAGLIEELRRRYPGIEVEGIGGPLLQAAGCRSLFPMERLSVMGLVEVLGRYAELRRIRAQVARHFLQHPPDVFIGIDAPDFNLGLERRLRAKGIRTVHYVSPSVWAWRRWRLRGVARSVDLMLVLFPFEERIYRDAGIPVACVGHPLADRIPSVPDQAAARARLGLDPAARLIAIMPGSRRGEVERLFTPFLLAAAEIRRRRPEALFICSPLDEASAELCRRAQAAIGLADLPVAFFPGRSHDVLEACDVALLASGTVTLEALLFKRPMVVAYRMNPLTFAILRAMVRIRFVALPNLLGGEALVPEYLQGDCTPVRLAEGALRWLEDDAAAGRLRSRFAEIHTHLRRGASSRAAEAVGELLC
ncbi:MAG TPA: lipid-A-disaccharide synthase [Gammaproteobacteria bacterium]